jgi:hypothetical protein
MGSADLKITLNKSYSEEFESTYIKYAQIISTLVKISHAHILTLLSSTYNVRSMTTIISSPTLVR